MARKSSATEITDLVDQAVMLHVTASNEEGDESYGKFLSTTAELRRFGMDVVFATIPLLNNPDPRNRSAGADILCRVVMDAPSEVHEECFALLLSGLQRERLHTNDDDVVASYATALGHLYDECAIPALIELAGHAESTVRYSAVAALPGACNFETRDDVADVLIKASADSAGNVRDWACFGLGQLHIDNPRVREALAVRLDDDNDDARSEALVALAQLGDERVVNHLLDRLAGGTVWTLEIEAVGEIAEPRLYDLLVKIKSWWKDEGDVEKLEFALRRCNPEACHLAEQYERTLIDRLSTELRPLGMTVTRSGAYPHTIVWVQRDGATVTDHSIWDGEDRFSSDVESDVELLLAWARG